MNLILDIDGTLWNTTEVVAKAWNRAVEQFGAADRVNVITAQALRKEFGKPMNVIADDLFPELTKTQKTELMEACCKEEHAELLLQKEDFCRKTLAYSDVCKTIRQLSEKHALYIVSNCQSGYGELVMEKLGIADCISDFECYGNTGKYKADNIRLVMERNRLSDAVYVGDTDGDRTASQQAGIPFVYAAYGFGTVENFWKKISKFSELTAIATEPATER